MADQGVQLADAVAVRAVEVVARQLVNARKFLQFYPEHNSHVQRTLDELHESLLRVIWGPSRHPGLDSVVLPREIEALAQPAAPEGLVLTAQKAELSWEGAPLCPSSRLIMRFATDLYRHDVRAIRFTKQTSRSDLQKLLELSAEVPAEVRSLGGFDEALVRAGVTAIEVVLRENVEIMDAPIEDMVEFFDGERAARGLDDPADLGLDREFEEEADLRDITDFFADVFSGAPEKMSYMMETLMDPDRLVSALEHLHGADTEAGSRKDAPLDYAVMRQSLKQLARSMKQFPPVMREEFVQNVARAILGTTTDTRQSIVENALPELIGEDPVAFEILADLPAADAADALLQAVRFHDGTADLIANFLDTHAQDPERRSKVVGHMLRLSSDEATENMSDVLELLRTEASYFEGAATPTADNIVDAKTLRAEQARLNSKMRFAESQRDELMRAIEAEVKDKTDEHAARTLVQLYITPTIEGVSKRTQERLTELFSHALDRGAYSFLAESIELAETELQEAARLRVLDALEPTLAECCYPQHLNRILSRMRVSGKHSDLYAQMVALLDFLGEPVLQHLFLRLELEKTRSMRMFFLDLFDVFGERALPILRRKTQHRDWFVVRNTAFILGGIRSQASLDMLDELLMHRDMRVRREAVRSIARMGTERGETILLRELDSSDPLMSRLAAEWLGRCGIKRALPELRKRVENTREGSRPHPDALIGMVEGLGMIGEREDARIIRRAIPRISWLGGEKKRELSLVGRKAIERLEMANS